VEASLKILNYRPEIVNTTNSELLIVEETCQSRRGTRNVAAPTSRRPNRTALLADRAGGAARMSGIAPRSGRGRQDLGLPWGGRHARRVGYHHYVE